MSRELRGVVEAADADFANSVQGACIAPPVGGHLLPLRSSGPRFVAHWHRRRASCDSLASSRRTDGVGTRAGRR